MPDGPFQRPFRKYRQGPGNFINLMNLKNSHSDYFDVFDAFDAFDVSLNRKQ